MNCVNELYQKEVIKVHMVDYVNTKTKVVSKGVIKIYDNLDEVVDDVGEKVTLALVNRANVIYQQNLLRRGSGETQRMKLMKILNLLKAKPELAKKLGIELD